MPFILSAVGGVFIALAGADEVYSGLNPTTGPFGGGGVNYDAFGLLGSVLGILIVIMAALLLVRPGLRVELGILITMFAVVSVLSFYGGFIVGLGLAVFGGLLGIAWRPKGLVAPWPGGGWQVPAHRVCLHCGRFLSFDMRVCPYCATPIT